MSKSAAFDNIAMYFPMVQKALARLGVLPYRTFSNVEEFREIFSDIEQIIIDVTELKKPVLKTQPNRRKVTVARKKRTWSKIPLLQQ
jgi:hypothetical protein